MLDCRQERVNRRVGDCRVNQGSFDARNRDSPLLLGSGPDRIVYEIEVHEPGRCVALLSENVLPPCSQRIRRYGLMSNSHRHHAFAECRRLLSLPIPQLLPNFPHDFRDLYLQLTAVDLRRCPVCKIATLIIVEVLPRIPYQDTS